MIEDGGSEASRDRYQSGPWLIMHGHGLVSEDRAREIARQCATRGVDYEITTIDEMILNKDLLRSFHAILISLPSVTGAARTGAIRRVAELVRAYRAVRSEGLLPLLDGTRQWFEVGVIQLFDDDRVVGRGLQSVERMVDRYHRLRDGDAIEPFAAYTCSDHLGHSSAEPGLASFARSVNKLRANLHSWGISWELAEIAEVRQFIDGMRETWESPAYSDLRRPVRGVERNRLDFLLDDPSYDPPMVECSRKKWMEGGQRVVTRVLSELEQRHPAVHLMPGRGGMKYKQREFQTLYQTLRAAEEVLRLEGMSHNASRLQPTEEREVLDPPPVRTHEQDPEFAGDPQLVTDIVEVSDVRQTPISVPAGLTPRLGFVVDIVGFGRRDAELREDVTHRLDALVGLMIAALGLDRSDTICEVGGDSMAVFLPVGMASVYVLPRLIAAASEHLARDNRRFRDRMRLRMAVGSGLLGSGPLGSTGQLVVDLHRLVDSDELRRVIVANEKADLALLVTHAVHDEVVRPGYLSEKDFTPVEITAKEFAATAWLRLC